MAISNDGLYWTAYGYSSSISWTLASGSDGLRTVYVSYSDMAGNNILFPYISASITVDTIPPAGSVTINSGATYATGTSVTLSLSCTDTSGCSQMKIANDDYNNLASAPAQAYSTPVSWTLSPGDAIKAVYVIFKDNAGNWMANNGATADTIILDTMKPDTFIDSVPTAMTTSTSATFAFSGTDAYTPLTFECSLDGASYSSCSSPKSYSGLAVAAHAFRVRATDPAGNVDPTPASQSWTVIAPGQSVNLYDGADKSGATCSFTADATDLGACDKIASAMDVPSGYVAAVYPNHNFNPSSGKCGSFDTSANFAYTLYDNAISAIKIWSSMDGVMMYSNAGFAGVADYFGNSMADISSGYSCLNWNVAGSAVSSLKLKSGYGITLYENPNLQGGCRTFFQNVDGLDYYAFDNKGRSFWLWKSGFNGAILYDTTGWDMTSNNEYYPADQTKYDLSSTNCVNKKAKSVYVSTGNVALLYGWSTTAYPAPGMTTLVTDVNNVDHIRVCPQTSTNCLPKSEDGFAPGINIKQPAGFTPSTGFVTTTVSAGGIVNFEIPSADAWVARCDLTIKDPSGLSSAYPMSVIWQGGVAFDATKAFTFFSPGLYEAHFSCTDLAGNVGIPTASSGAEQYVKINVCGSQSNPKSMGSIGIGGSATGSTCSLTSSPSEDWFNVATTGSGRISIDLGCPVASNWNYQLIDSSNTVKLQGTSACDLGGTTTSFMPADSYKIKVWRNSGDGIGTVTAGLTTATTTTTTTSSTTTTTIPNDCQTSWSPQQILAAYQAKTGHNSCVDDYGIENGVAPKCAEQLANSGIYTFKCSPKCVSNDDCLPIDNRNTCCTADSSLDNDKQINNGKCVSKNNKLASDKWICDPGTWMGCAENNAGQIINSNGEQFRCSNKDGNYSWEKQQEEKDFSSSVVSAFVKAFGILINGIALRI